MLLKKGVYQYEYMDEWGKVNETSIPGKQDFYSNLNMEDVTDTDCMHACKRSLSRLWNKKCSWISHLLS